MNDTAYARAIALATQSADDIEAGRAFVPAEVAASLVAAQVEDYREALAEERAHAAGLTQDCEEMVRRLDRLHDHLRNGVVPLVMRKLADYAGGFADYEAGIVYDERDNPPPDPFPDPEPPATSKRRKRKGASC